MKLETLKLLTIVVSSAIGIIASISDTRVPNQRKEMNLWQRLNAWGRISAVLALVALVVGVLAQTKESSEQDEKDNQFQTNTITLLRQANETLLNVKKLQRFEIFLADVSCDLEPLSVPGISNALSLYRGVTGDALHDPSNPAAWTEQKEY